MKRAITLILTLTILLSLCVFSGTAYAADEITITDMIGREVTVTPGSYQRVVCIGAGALRMYSYIGDVNLLCGVEDIDNTSLAERPKMFDSVARPYMLAYGDSFKALPSCGVGGPQAQTAEAEKILACNPDIVISEYEDVEKEDALQEQLGVPVVTLKAGPGGVFDENFFGTMRMLGTIFQNEEKAEALVSFIEDERAEISRRTADVTEEDKPSVSVDLSKLSAVDSMHVAQDGVLQEALCWECNNTKLGAKRIIRQLAAKSAEGFLLIEGGMTPSVCDNGKHVDRPGKTVPHWDLNGITAFAAWARRCLGDGWRVVVKQPKPWDALPSLQGLFAQNGFEAANEPMEEDAE